MPDFPTVTFTPQQHAWDYQIPCIVCGARLRVITASHLRRHNLTVAEYVERFPDAPLACNEVGRKISEHHSGKSQSPQHVEKRTEATVTTRRANASYARSEETKSRISRTLTGRSLSEAHKAAIGAATQRQWDAGERKQCFDPKWEQDAAGWLVDAGIEFHHQFHIPGFPHPYDFYLPGFNLLIELDGCYWHGCECQGGPQNEFIESNVSRDRECDGIAANFGYRLVRLRECEFSKEKFMGVCHA